MRARRVFDYMRYEFDTQPETVTLYIYDDGRVKLWTGEYKAWLSPEQRSELARLLDRDPIGKL